MNILWGLVRAVIFGFGALIALLVVIDAALLENLVRKPQ
jgi:hypothetical protein